MKMCQEHWNMLKDEVTNQGLDKLVSANSDIAIMKLEAELKGEEDSKEIFDPLMRCNFIIMNRALELVGLQSMSPDFGCPICKFNEALSEEGYCLCNDLSCPGKTTPIPRFESWLVGPESCVTIVKKYAQDNNWI